MYTTYAPDFNFSETYTYSLPDHVIDLENSKEGNPEYINEASSTAVLSAVKTNLHALGWNEVNADDAKIVIVAAGFDQTFLSYNQNMKLTMA